MSKIKESQKQFTFEKISIVGPIVSSIIGIIFIMFFGYFAKDFGSVIFLLLIMLSIVICNFQTKKENKLKLEKKIHEANSEIAYKQILESPNKFNSKEKIKQFYIAHLIIDKKDYQTALNIVTEVIEEEYKKINKLEKEIDESKNYKVKLLNTNKNSLDKDPLYKIEKENKIKQIESKLSKQIENRKILLDKLDEINPLKYQLTYIIAMEKEDYHSIDKQIKDLLEINKDDFTGIVTLYKDEIKKLV